MLNTYPDKEVDSWPVTSFVNIPNNDSEELIKPVRTSKVLNDKFF